MRQESTNPVKNCLPSGVKEENLCTAIESSGYPLQGLVAQKLSSSFSVSEEWGYIDRDSKEHRSLDVFGFKELAKGNTSPVSPGLVLLIECKRSVHPFVFFKNITDKPIPEFPAIAGLIREVVDIREASGKRFQEVKGARALSLDMHPFVLNGPARCSAFSRVTPSGSKVELNGTEIFNGLVLPLVKAFDHAATLFKAREKPDKLYPRLVMPIGVLDAPMILVESPQKASDPVLVPWIRIVRQESVKDPNSWQRFRFYGIDIVHIDYLENYLADHLIPFAKEYGERAVQMAEILLRGGEIMDLNDWNWDQIQIRKR